MTDNLIKTSFSSGEMSPTVFGREDLPKVATAGATVMRNFFVDYRGGASSRAGTAYLSRARFDATVFRLIDFQFSITQAYVLEFGDYYMRVIKDGGLVLEPALAITSAAGSNATIGSNPWVVGDWVFITQTSQIYKVKTAGTTVTLSDLDGNAVVLTGVTGPIARVYTLTTPWAAADVFELKFTQSADVLTITHPNYPIYDVNRIQHYLWTLTAVPFGPVIGGPAITDIEPTHVTHPNTGSTATDAYYEYQVTTVTPSGEESEPLGAVGLFCYNMGIDAQTVILTWKPRPGAAYYNIYRAASFNNTKVPAGAIHGYVGQSYGSVFTDDNIIANFTRTPPRYNNPFVPGQINQITVTNAGGGYPVNATTFNITDPTGTGYQGYTVINADGTLSGIVTIKSGQGYTNPVGVIAGAGGSGATVSISVALNSGTYPSTCTYFQQRRIFAASASFPETIWGTKVGAPNNMDYSNPVVDSDSFQFTLASNQVNNIKFMVGMPGGLLAFTGSSIWRLSGGGQNAPLTPSNAFADAQSYTGAADVKPIPINYSILYVQQKGSIVRDLAYNFYANIYTGVDTTVLSNHLFYGHQIIEWAYAEEPFKILWAVREDGTLLSLTYLKEQEIAGWARHDSLGIFETVVSIPSASGTEDDVYFGVRRKVGGKWIRMIEILQSRNFDQGADTPWCVDSGVQYLSGIVNGLEGDASAASGIINFSAVGQFSAGSIGQVLRFGGGRGLVTGYVDPNNVTVTLDRPITLVLADGSPAPQTRWSLSINTTVVTGLDHLNGLEVVGLADGIPVGPFTVVAGAINLVTPASLITLGLPYTPQLQTMYIEAGGGPTIQGKRKEIQAATCRINETRGLKVGKDFDQLELIRDSRFGTLDPLALLSQDERKNLATGWSEYGQICFQQDSPLPATVLAVVYELNMGN